MSEALTFPTLKRAEHTRDDFDREAPVKLWHGLYIKAHAGSEILDPDRVFAHKCFPTFGSYQVGLLEGYEESDPVIFTLEGAREKARKMSLDSAMDKLSYYPVAVAVWDMPSGDILFIFYSGQGFEP